MRQVSLLALAVMVSASVSSAQADDKDKWVSLFDGKTLNGWKMAEHGQAKYTVADGTIRGGTVEGSPNSFLITEKEYADFELEFEVKVHDQLNSGVQIRSRGKTREDVGPDTKQGIGVFHGPQVEIEAGPGQAGYIYGESTQYGWLSPEPKDEKHSHDYFRNGEWNKYRIVAKGPHIQTWINGHMVADLTHDGIYKTHPKGHIGLQVHGVAKGTGPFDVAWRDIRIKEL